MFNAQCSIFREGMHAAARKIDNTQIFHLKYQILNIQSLFGFNFEIITGKTMSMITRFLIILCTAFTLSSCDTLSNLPMGGVGGTTGISEFEAAQGIREALDQGVGRGISTLNRQDGFFGNQAYKLFLPAEAQRIENTLRQIGMGSMVDKAILQINRAA